MIGDNLRRLRRTADYTQDALGQAVGCTGAQIRHYEKGVSDIPASRLLDIATTLNTPIEEFFK